MKTNHQRGKKKEKMKTKRVFILNEGTYLHCWELLTFGSSGKRTRKKCQKVTGSSLAKFDFYSK